MILGARADPAPATTHATAPQSRTLATPLWSPRRVPAIFVDAVAANRLDQQLASVVSPFDSCVSVDDGAAALVRINPTHALAEASTQKLLVAAAALSVLGPTHRFTTRAVTAAPVQGGDISGDLVIVGGGDPVLTSVPGAAQPSTSLSDLADAIVRAGVRRIDGSLVADDSRYDRTREVPDWKPSETAEGDVGALGALVVNGGRADNASTPAADPALDTVDDLASLLEARGVQISGGERDATATTPASDHEIAHVDSPALAAIVEQMLTVSNNETAELLTREVAVASGAPGSTTAGTHAVIAALGRLGVPTAGLDLHDGSGLAPDDRVTCNALLGVIGLTQRPAFAAIVKGLPVAGETGTLAGRLVGTPLAGRLHAKTGHIDGVVGLAGLIGPGIPSSGARFAFISNGSFSTDEGANLQDEIATTIGGYPNAPAASTLVPAPEAAG